MKDSRSVTVSDKKLRAVLYFAMRFEHCGVYLEEIIQLSFKKLGKDMRRSGRHNVLVSCDRVSYKCLLEMFHKDNDREEIGHVVVLFTTFVIREQFNFLEKETMVNARTSVDLYERMDRFVPHLD
jgi:hypothetical protein